MRSRDLIELKVHLAKDEESGIWYIAMSDIPGLRLEADSADELIRKVEDVAPDLVELNADEIMAAHRARVRHRAPKPAVSIRPVFDSAMPVLCPA